MKKKLSILVLVVFSVFGCSKDTIIDEPIVETDNGMKSLFNYDINEEKLLIWAPEDFQTAQDVVIESADTTMISISKAFYERMEKKVGIQSVLNITLSDEDLPFIRKVAFIDPQGDRYYLETEQATLEDMFKNLDIELSSMPYYSDANAIRFGNQIAGFIDEKQVSHPVKYIIDYEDGIREVYDLRTNTLTRASLDIRLSWEDKVKLKIPISAFDLEINLKSKITAYTHVGINISWFKLQRFEAKIGGGIDLDVPMSLGITWDMIKQCEYNNDILNGPRVSAVVMVGPIPVSIGVTPKLNFNASFGLNGYAKINFGFSYNMQYEAGVLYQRGIGWSPIRSFHQNLNAHEFIATAGVEASAKAGLYAKLALDIYNSEVVSAKVGAYIKGVAGAEIATNTSGITVNYNCVWGVDAHLNAQVKILNYTLASWDHPLGNIYGPVTLLDYKKTYPWSELSGL